MDLVSKFLRMETVTKDFIVKESLMAEEDINGKMEDTIKVLFRRE